MQELSDYSFLFSLELNLKSRDKTNSRERTKDEAVSSRRKARQSNEIGRVIYLHIEQLYIEELYIES